MIIRLFSNKETDLGNGGNIKTGNVKGVSKRWWQKCQPWQLPTQLPDDCPSDMKQVVAPT